MKTLFVALLMLTSSLALAQVDVRVSVPVPTITFEAPPPLVVVSPGVQVVPNYEQEVFFSDGWYWSRHGDGWFRTRDHHGGWVMVERERVPSALVRMPPGHYRRYQAVERERVIVAPPPGREVRHEYREERREHEERHDHDERKEERREEKHESKGKGGKGKRD